MSDRSHRVRNANSLFPFRKVSVSPKWAISPTEFAWPTLCLPIIKIGLTEFMWSLSPRLRYALTLTQLVPPKILTFTFWTKSVWPSLCIRSHRVWQIVCTVRFCVEAIYTPPPFLHSWREPSEHSYTSSIHFRERTTYSCVETKIFQSNHKNLDL